MLLSEIDCDQPTKTIKENVFSIREQLFSKSKIDEISQIIQKQNNIIFLGKKILSEYEFITLSSGLESKLNDLYDVYINFGNDNDINELIANSIFNENKSNRNRP